jgi:hypothetical protein
LRAGVRVPPFRTQHSALCIWLRAGVRVPPFRTLHSALCIWLRAGVRVPPFRTLHSALCIWLGAGVLAHSLCRPPPPILHSPFFILHSYASPALHRKSSPRPPTPSPIFYLPSTAQPEAKPGPCSRGLRPPTGIAARTTTLPGHALCKVHERLETPSYSLPAGHSQSVPGRTGPRRLLQTRRLRAFQAPRPGVALAVSVRAMPHGTPHAKSTQYGQRWAPQAMGSH